MPSETGTEKAVVDRIEDGLHALLLVGDSEATHVVRLAELPPGTKEGDWLRVRFTAERLVFAAPDPEETQRVRQRVQEMMDRLRQRRQPPR